MWQPWISSLLPLVLVSELSLTLSLFLDLPSQILPIPWFSPSPNTQYYFSSLSLSHSLLLSPYFSRRKRGRGRKPPKNGLLSETSRPPPPLLLRRQDCAALELQRRQCRLPTSLLVSLRPLLFGSARRLRQVSFGQSAAESVCGPGVVLFFSRRHR